MFSFFNRRVSNKKEREPLVINRSNREDTVILMENNHINSLPVELINIILSFLSIKNLANLSMVNKPFYEGIYQFIPMKEKTKDPFYMFINGSGTKTPATYAQVRPIIVKNVPLEKRLNVIANDVVRKKFEKNAVFSAAATFCLIAFLGAIGTVIIEGALFNFHQTKNHQESLQMLAPLIVGVALGLTLGCLCYHRHSKMDKEEDQLNPQITRLPSLN